jgi:hypothetical protein
LAFLIGKETEKLDFKLLNMKYILLFCLFISTVNYANDGAFFAKGNQLIPISETDISIKKEILTLKKVNNKIIEVTVYYEFFNPKAEKNLTVGFEAFSPSGDVDGTPIKGQHPYMKNFTVDLNGQLLKYDIAYVDKESYTSNGIINGIINGKKLSEVVNKIDNVNEVIFFYVYHFNAQFKQGLNIIKHTYQYDISGSVDYNYDFEYVLTAANRWGNRQIDDFTLNLEMGEFESFNVNKSFFKEKSEWQIEGVAKTENIKGSKNSFIESDALRFHLQKGKICFKKTNFNPKGELFVYSQNHLGYSNLEYIPFSYFQQDFIANPKTEFDKKILKNLPFARRGFVFKSKDLSSYFEKIDWYIADPNYVPDLKTLHPLEKQWLSKLK